MEAKKVYIVAYSFTNTEDTNDDYIKVKAFDTEVKARDYLKKDYDLALSELSDEDCAYVIKDSGFYNSSAVIYVGEEDIVYRYHSWRIYTDVVNSGFNK